MDVIVAILLAGGILSIGTHLIRRGRERAAARERPQDPRTLDQVQVGDVVLFQRKDLIVEMVIEVTEGGSRWRVCRLVDGQEQYAMRLIVDSDLLFIGHQIDPLIAGEPPESLDHDGDIFTLRACGQATVASSQPPGAVSGSWEYWEYARAGHDRLWLHRSQGAQLCYRGEQTARHMVNFIPA